MLTKTLVLVITLTLGALALEVVFGVHLGIRAWVHGHVGVDQITLVQMR